MELKSWGGAVLAAIVLAGVLYVLLEVLRLL